MTPTEYGKGVGDFFSLEKGMRTRKLLPCCEVRGGDFFSLEKGTRTRKLLPCCEAAGELVH